MVVLPGEVDVAVVVPQPAKTAAEIRTAAADPTRTFEGYVRTTSSVVRAGGGESRE